MIVQRHILPASDILIHVTLFQVDGGILATAMNAITLALIDAGIPLLDYAVGVSLAYHPETQSVLWDVTKAEEMAQQGALSIATVFVLPRSKQILSTQLEPPHKVPVDALASLLDAGLAASLELFAIMDDVVRACKFPTEN